MHAIANYLHTPPPARRRRRRRAATTRMAPAGVAILLTFYVVKQTQRGGRDFFLHAKRIIFGHSRFLSQQLVINLPGSCPGRRSLSPFNFSHLVLFGGKTEKFFVANLTHQPIV